MKSSISSSSRETKKFGKEFAAQVIGAGFGRAARVVALSGDLGSGKTTFVQGFLRAFGIRRAASPTFVIVRRMSVRRGPFQNIFHIDAYRVLAKDLDALGVTRLMRDPRNIILIEWADRVLRLLPKDALYVALAHGSQENERIIILKPETRNQ